MSLLFPRVLAASFLLVLAALLYLTIATSADLANLEGVSALACDPARQRVLAAAHGEVWILSEAGLVEGRLQDRGGRPASFTGISSIATGDDGRIWVVEPPLHRISRYDARGIFECVVAESPEVVFRAASVLPLPAGRFLVSDTLAHALRLHDAGGELLAERRASAPNGLLALEDGAAVVLSGVSEVRAFDDRLEPRPLPEELEPPPIRGSIYEIDVDRAGAFYWNDCPAETDCVVYRRRPGSTEAEVVAADAWIAGFDGSDPSYSFCATGDGRVLVASRTLEAIVEFSGAGEALSPPEKLDWDLLLAGFGKNTQSAAPLTARIFGDEPFRRWIEAGRLKKEALRKRVRLGRVLLGGLLTTLLILYLFERLLGRHRRIRETGRQLLEIARDVLWPDRRPIVLWARPALLWLAFGAALTFTLARYKIAGLAELTALAVLIGLLTHHLLRPGRLAAGRSPHTARRAFEIYMDSRAARPLPWSVAVRAELASFAVPRRRGEKLDEWLGEALQKSGAVADDPFDLTRYLEGGLHLVAFGERRLVWYPCQLGGKPRGAIRVAACRPAEEPAPEGEARLPSGEGVLRLPDGARAGLAEDLIARLGAAPKFGPVEELCEECGRELFRDPRKRCRHYRDRRRLALILAVLLPGLGHLAARRLKRGRWLALASGLLLSRLSYLGLPVALGTLPMRPSLFLLPALLYGALWWISWSEVRGFWRRRREV